MLAVNWMILSLNIQKNHIQSLVFSIFPCLHPFLPSSCSNFFSDYSSTVFSHIYEKSFMYLTHVPLFHIKCDKIYIIFFYFDFFLHSTTYPEDHSLFVYRDSSHSFLHLDNASLCEYTLVYSADPILMII